MSTNYSVNILVFDITVIITNVREYLFKNDESHQNQCTAKSYTVENVLRLTKSFNVWFPKQLSQESVKNIESHIFLLTIVACTMPTFRQGLSSSELKNFFSLF